MLITWKTHHCPPGVAAAGYISARQQYPGWSPCKTLNISWANEITHDECGQPPVIRYNVGRFQLYAAHVTCYIWDVEANIRIHKTVQLLVRFGRWVVILEFHECLPIFQSGWIFSTIYQRWSDYNTNVLEYDYFRMYSSMTTLEYNHDYFHDYFNEYPVSNIKATFMESLGVVLFCCCVTI